jgi:hypothetical protein
MGTVVTMKNTRTVKEWRAYISEPWQKAVESIVETGLRLIQAKENVEHGEWLKIFEENKPFSVNTAQRLMIVAKNNILANAAHAQHLPPSWYTLYELSIIPEHQLLKMIQDGKIHSELTRSEAEALKGYEEKMEALRVIIIHSCESAISMAPCDCRDLENEITPGVMIKVQDVIDTWSRVRDYLLSLGMKERRDGS